MYVKFYQFFQCFVICVLLHILLLKHGDIEINPGPHSGQSKRQ